MNEAGRDKPTEFGLERKTGRDKPAEFGIERKTGRDKPVPYRDIYFNRDSVKCGRMPFNMAPNIFGLAATILPLRR